MIQTDSAMLCRNVSIAYRLRIDRSIRANNVDASTKASTPTTATRMLEFLGDSKRVAAARNELTLGSI